MDKIDKDLEILKSYFQQVFENIYLTSNIYFVQVQNITAFVYVFRNDVEPSRSWQISGGNSDSLISFLRAVCKEWASLAPSLSPSRVSNLL
jgi:hypothetical protein